MSARGPVLDRFRLLAAVLVVCIHTGPLAGCNAAADFWLCRVFARIAVPFFLMVSGYFLEKDQWRGAERFLKKTLAIYAAAVLLYLPLNLYGGGYHLPEWGKRLFLDGTLYHLW
ncbi:MAG: acyltransferase, partial [Oscillibacter sp.]|nr:acyltransferase [Oscillibacter sp.]